MMGEERNIRSPIKEDTVQVMEEDDVSKCIRND
jgi:hypothetical protein